MWKTTCEHKRKILHIFFAEVFFRPSLYFPGFQSFPGGLSRKISWKFLQEDFLAFIYWRNEHKEDFQVALLIGE